VEEESLQYAGEVVVEEIYITSAANPDSIDISNLMIEINLYEDIFSPTLHGSILLADSINLITELPMLGTELITLKLRTPTLEDHPINTIEKTFQVYSITNKTLNNDRGQYYSLNFISKETYLDNAIAVSKTFEGNTVDIVRQIFKMIQTPRRIDSERKTGIVIMDTPHASEIKYTSCYWSPMKNLAFIGTRAKGNSVAEGDFIFYESNKGFYFTSLEALIAHQKSQGVFDEYVYELVADTIPRFNPQKTGNPLPSDCTRIEEMVVPKLLDILDGQDSGYYGNTIRGYDMFTKKMTEIVFDARKEMSNFYKTDDGNPIPGDVINDPGKNIQFESYNTALYNNYGLSSDEHSNKIVFRKSYLNSFNQFKFEITIPGRTDMEVGNIISILYPSPKAKLGDETELDDVFDPLLTGTYIVSAMHHVISQDRHYIKAEVIKNGLAKDLGKRK